MTSVEPSQPAPAGAILLRREGALLFCGVALAGAGIGAALCPKRPVLGAVIGSFGGMALPVLVTVAVLLPLAKAKVGA